MTHTEAEVEALKRKWRSDPCWRLASTKGFEAHADELEAYENAYWTERQRAFEHKEQTDRESQPAYWLKELVTEVRTLNAHLANIDSRLDDMAQAVRNRV
jgi:hypothetical protein